MKKCLTVKEALKILGETEFTNLSNGNVPGAFYNEQYKQWFFEYHAIQNYKLTIQNSLEKILFHVTTPKKVQAYHKTGHIIAPVRGFTTIEAAMVWAMKTQRSVILQITGYQDLCHKLPDHHNPYGEAWWFDMNIKKWKCIISPNKF